PILFSPCASPTVVVLLPSPSGVGLIAVTTTYLPRGLAASTRSIPASVTFAFVCPYGSISSSCSPRSRATSMIGRGVTDRAISRSEGKLIEVLDWRRRRVDRERWQRRPTGVGAARAAGRPGHRQRPRRSSPGQAPRGRDGRGAGRSS